MKLNRSKPDPEDSEAATEEAVVPWFWWAQAKRGNQGRALGAGADAQTP